jgi:hypothetical protein
MAESLRVEAALLLIEKDPRLFYLRQSLHLDLLHLPR